jgi:hypothetical protein
VVWGQPLEQVLAKAGLLPDFQQVTPVSGIPLRYIHRHVGSAEAFFVADGNPQPATIECRFRVKGMQPELWHPETGQIERPAVWHEESAATVLPIRFTPVGSVFVLFRQPSGDLDPISTITRGGQIDSGAWATFTPDGRLQLLAAKPGSYQLRTVSGKNLVAKIDTLPAPQVVSGPWELQFPKDAGAPEWVTLEQLTSWSVHTNPGVRYFSGIATYTRTIHLPPDFIQEKRRVLLDLGRVEVMARLKVNGKDLGILWKPPFEADITSAAKAGENAIELQVVNLWPNRLIGDEQLPDDCEWNPPDGQYGRGIAAWPQWLLEGKPSPTGRVTFTTWRHWTKDSRLLESGLLGPVTLRVEQELTPEPVNRAERRSGN